MAQASTDTSKSATTIPIPTTSTHEHPSDKIWSVYLSEADKYDRALIESWKQDMDGILIFAGLFSAIVTAFIIESYKMLKPDQSFAILVRISQQLEAISNGSQATAAARDPNDTTSPPKLSALRCNAFWFLSLSFSLMCALAATFVKQYARNYLHAVERCPVPHKRARIRAYMHKGLQKFGMMTLVESVPTLLHVSLFLFFAGLFDFLHPINILIAHMTLGICIVCTSVYVACTVLPSFYYDCPYQTPLFRTWRRFLRVVLFFRYRRRSALKETIIRDREDAVMRDVDGCKQRDEDALRWTLESITEDAELEPFVEGIPGYLNSPGVTSVYNHEIMQGLLDQDDIQLGARIIQLLMTCRHRGWLLFSQQQKRAMVCMNAISSLVAKPSSSITSTVPSNHLTTTWISEDMLKIFHQFSTKPDSDLTRHCQRTMAVISMRLLDNFANDADLGRGGKMEGTLVGLRRGMGEDDQGSDSEEARRSLVMDVERKLSHALILRHLDIVHSVARTTLKAFVAMRRLLEQPDLSRISQFSNTMQDSLDVLADAQKECREARVVVLIHQAAIHCKKPSKDEFDCICSIISAWRVCPGDDPDLFPSIKQLLRSLVWNRDAEYDLGLYEPVKFPEGLINSLHQVACHLKVEKWRLIARDLIPSFSGAGARKDA